MPSENPTDFCECGKTLGEHGVATSVADHYFRAASPAGSATPTPQTALPRWIFDHAGERFLVAIKPSGEATIDGGHTEPQDVAKARALFEALDVIRPPAGTQYVMLTVEAVPAFTGTLNHDAVSTNNHAAAALHTPKETPRDE